MMEKSLNWMNGFNNILQKYKLNFDPVDIFFLALSVYGICSDTKEAEESVTDYLQNKAKELSNVNRIWEQAVFAYLWHNINYQAALAWERFCFVHGVVLFTVDKLDQLRRGYICQNNFERNICRILFELDNVNDLDEQLKYLNDYEYRSIKEKIAVFCPN